MSIVHLPQPICTCGRVIGDRFMDYVKLVENDNISHKDAMDLIGLDRICCRTSVMSPSPYLLRNGNTGTTSLQYSNIDSNTKTTPRNKVLDLDSKHSRSAGRYGSLSKFTRPEPKQDFDFKFLRKGEVAVVGFEREQNGSIKMVDVGDNPGKYLVPTLVLCHGVANNNILN